MRHCKDLVHLHTTHILRLPEFGNSKEHLCCLHNSKGITLSQGEGKEGGEEGRGRREEWGEERGVGGGGEGRGSGGEVEDEEGEVHITCNTRIQGHNPCVQTWHNF